MQRFDAIIALGALLAIAVPARPANAQDTTQPVRQPRQPSMTEIRRQLDALDAARNELNQKHLTWREAARLDSAFAPSLARSDSAVIEVVYSADSTPILWTFNQSGSPDDPKNSIVEDPIRLAQSTKSTSLIRLGHGDWDVTLTVRSRDGQTRVFPPQRVHVNGRRVYRLAFGEAEENRFRSVLRDEKRAGGA